jgi:hypothetical protein
MRARTLRTGMAPQPPHVCSVSRAPGGAVMIALGLLISLLSVPVSSVGLEGAEVVKHSGTIVAIDEAGGAIVLAEMGPWRAASEPAVLFHAFTVTEATEFAIVRRAEHSAEFPGAWTEMVLVDWNISDGDFITVECTHEGRHMIAIKITVVDNGGGLSPCSMARRKGELC